MAKKTKKVAVFDVDGTIFRSSLLIQIVNKLVEQKIFPKRAEALYDRKREKWLDREGDFGAYINAMVHAFAKHIRGVHYGVLKNVAEEVMDEQWKRTYRYTRDLLKDLKGKGYFLLVVSHSPKTVLDQFCPRLGFDKTYGTIYETDARERFTGNVIDQHLIANKAAVLRRAAEKENLTLVHSVGVGDTESDIAFLELVAKPICFNPNAKLYAHAKREKWKVIVERKDVVYEM